MVGHEERVEPAALERLGETLEMLEVEIRVRIGARIAPPAGMDADRAHERAETQLPVGHWDLVSSRWKSPAQPAIVYQDYILIASCPEPAGLRRPPRLGLLGIP